MRYHTSHYIFWKHQAFKGGQAKDGIILNINKQSYRTIIIGCLLALLGHSSNSDKEVGRNIKNKFCIRDSVQLNIQINCSLKISAKWEIKAKWLSWDSVSFIIVLVQDMVHWNQNIQYIKSLGRNNNPKTKSAV